MPISHENVESAIREVFETSTSSRVLGTSHSRGAERVIPEVAATLTLDGKSTVTMVLSCTWVHAEAAARGMLGPDTGLDSDLVHDAMGEVLNQIGGTIKRNLGVGGSQVRLSVPVVVSGSPLGHKVKSSADPLWVEVDTDSGRFCLCLWDA